ncbi:MAG: coenzyme F430 synthase [Candidatus Methanoplasma sp.]|jgi:UDP-N-acetylmuramyl pentapeptide synthase|nr:coenzyme F430 synthase [Candidatus Methanoplasma sp.]
MKALILDMVHGGEILAEEYLKAGYTVECVDVYGIAKQDVKDELHRKGVSAHLSAPEGHYDLVLMPVHCPDMFLKGVTYGCKKTFHAAVGELSDGRSRIEVTGVKGKTSCCYLLAHILALDGRSVFLHTSRGQGPWKDGKHAIEKRMSIAPPSLLRLPEGYDTTIAEVSLGGSGRAELTILTNLAEDYGIAAGTRKASDAKASVFSEGRNIVPKSEIGFWSRYREGLIGYGGRVGVIGNTEIGKPSRIGIEYKGRHELELPGKYIHLQYIDTIEAVLEACSEMDVPASQVIEGLKTFEGVPGRGELRRSGTGWEITDRNPGISHMSVDRILDVLGRMGLLPETMVILDPVNRKVCEKMDTERIRKMVECKGADFHLVGDEEEQPSDKYVTLRLIKEGYQ